MELTIPATEPTPTPLALRTDGDEELVSLLSAWMLTVASENTRKAYAADVSLWVNWCRSVGADPIHASRIQVDAWVEALRTGSTIIPGPRPVGQTTQRSTGKPPSPSTIRRRVMALSGWFGFLAEEDVITKNPMARKTRKAAAKPVDPDSSTTVGLDRDDARAFVAALEYEEPAWVLLGFMLLVVGCRVSEVTDVNWEDIGYDRGHCTVTVTRKGGRRQNLALPPMACDALDRLREVTPPEAQHGPLFLAADGQRADRYDVRRMVRRVSRRAHLRQWGQLTPHSLRHSYATLALDAGASLRDLQDAMGHADPRTTRRYDRSRGRLDRSTSYTVASFLS